MNITERQVEYAEKNWNRLEPWQQEKLVIRAEIMTGQKWIGAVVWGIVGVLIASVLSVVVFGVTKSSALGLIALVAFVAFAGGYIMGVRNN